MSAKLLIPLLLVFAVALSGCTSAPAGTGDLVLQITDKPGLDIQKAEVTISRIQVHTAPAVSNESNDSSEPASGWITITEEPQVFDLVAITDVKEFLGENELSPGTYTQIRLDVESALVTINGTQYNLTIPSKTVKIVRSFQIVENQTTTLTLDFNAEQSIHSAGQDYIMRPTIQIIQEVRPEKENGCTASGGTVTKSLCCKSANSFPNTCVIGACGCSPENSKQTKVCDCGEGKCFNGTACVDV